MALVHTWDLANATDQQPIFDDGAVQLALDVYREILPAEGRQEMFDAIFATMPEEMQPEEVRGPAPYAMAVPISANAPLIEQLAAHQGRNPAAF